MFGVGVEVFLHLHPTALPCPSRTIDCPTMVILVFTIDQPSLPLNEQYFICYISFYNFWFLFFVFTKQRRTLSLCLKTGSVGRRDGRLRASDSIWARMVEATVTVTTAGSATGAAVIRSSPRPFVLAQTKYSPSTNRKKKQ